MDDERPTDTDRTGDEDPRDEDRAEPLRDASQVSYDCSPWAGETRRLLAGMLDNGAVLHAWEGTVLVVRREDEARVDELVEEVLATAVGALDPDLARVAYEVSGLPAALQNELVDSLAVEGIPHEWDTEGDLVVHEDDAPRLEELLAALDLEADDEGDEAAEELDGLELRERLEALLLSAGRLADDPEDRRASLDLLDADEALEGVGAPFGVDEVTWTSVLDGSAELVAALRAGFEGHGALHADDEPDLPPPEPGGEPDPGRRERAGDGPGSLGGVPLRRDEQSPAAGDDVEGDASVQARARVLRDLLRRFV